MRQRCTPNAHDETVACIWMCMCIPIHACILACINYNYVHGGSICMCVHVLLPVHVCVLAFVCACRCITRD